MAKSMSSSIAKGGGNRKHNIREQEYWPQNVDQERTELNEVLVDRDIQEVYHSLFDIPLAVYNKSQYDKNHPERMIKDYYKHINHSKKNKTFHELIIQCGNKDNHMSVEESNAVYAEFLDEFQKNNPQMVVIGAYIHNDESTPHMHLDYIPVAEYGRGMSKRVANDRCIRQMGYKNWSEWADKQMLTLEKVMNRHGYVRENMHNHSNHVSSVKRYIQIQNEIERQAKKKLDKISVPKVAYKTNPLTKKETITFQKSEYQSILEKHEIEKRSYEAHIERLSNENKLLGATVAKFKNKPYKLLNDELEHSNESLKAKITDLEHENSKLKSLNSDLNIEKVGLEDRCDELERYENAYYSSENENNRLKSRINHLEDEIKRYQPEHLQSLTTELEQTKAINKDLSSRIDSQVNEIDKLTTRNNSLREENTKLNKLVEDLKHKYKNITRDIEVMCYRLRSVKRIINNFGRYIDESGKGIFSSIQKSIDEWIKDTRTKIYEELKPDIQENVDYNSIMDVFKNLDEKELYFIDTSLSIGRIAVPETGVYKGVIDLETRKGYRLELVTPCNSYQEAQRWFPNVEMHGNNINKLIEQSNKVKREHGLENHRRGYER